MKSIQDDSYYGEDRLDRRSCRSPSGHGLITREANSRVMRSEGEAEDERLAGSARAVPAGKLTEQSLSRGKFTAHIFNHPPDLEVGQEGEEFAGREFGLGLELE